MAWDTTKNPLDDFLSSDYNDMVTDQKLRLKTMGDSTQAGSALTGSDGDLGRVITLSNTLAIVGSVVFRNGAMIDVSEYTLTSTGLNDTITFNTLNIFNDDRIRVLWWTR